MLWDQILVANIKNQNTPVIWMKKEWAMLSRKDESRILKNDSFLGA